MQVVNKVLSKWKKKTELKTHSISLNLVKDLDKFVSDGVSKGKQMKGFVNDAEKIGSVISDIEQEIISKTKEYNVNIDSFNTTRNSVIAFWTRASKKYEEIVNISSDLGIPVPSKVESSFSEIDKLYNFQKNAYPKAPVKEKKIPNFK
jgi:hypothetical protein